MAMWSGIIISPIVSVFGVIGIVVGCVGFVVGKVVASFRNDAMKLVRSASRSML